MGLISALNRLFKIEEAGPPEKDFEEGFRRFQNDYGDINMVAGDIIDVPINPPHTVRFRVMKVGHDGVAVRVLQNWYEPTK